MTGRNGCCGWSSASARTPSSSATWSQRLGIPPLNETPGLEVYGNEERVWVTNHKGPWQSVTVLVHRLSEIDTPAFREFLHEAAASFHAEPEADADEAGRRDAVEGQRRALAPGRQGLPAGQEAAWDRALLPRLLELVREVEPGLQVHWDNRAAITLRVPGVSRAWAQWRTKDADGLDCRFLGKKGQFNLSRLEGVGASTAVRRCQARRRRRDAAGVSASGTVAGGEAEGTAGRTSGRFPRGVRQVRRLNITVAT